MIAGSNHPGVRTNWRNDGRGFQAEIAMTTQTYRARGIATIAKTDPPTRVVGGGLGRRIIYMENPWLDYLGVWTAHHGRALLIEAKAVDGRLPFKASGGLSETQWIAMKAWRRAGAACCLLWRQKGRVCLYTPERLAEADAREDLSLCFEDGLPVPQGEGMAIWDFLPVLENAIWPQEIVKQTS